MENNTTIGRPTLYTPEIAADICNRLAGGQSLRAICKEDGMPDKATIFRWLYKHKEFSNQYALAREAWAEVEFDNLLQIADDGTNDYREAGEVAGAKVYEVDHDHIARSRLRVDTRKWALSKMLPKKFGDKMHNEITSPDGSLGAMDETALAAKIKSIVTAAERRRAGEPDDASDLV